MVTKEEALRDLNLSDKEVNVYVSLLMLGQSPANTIAKKANLNRVTTYDILKSLQEKGAVSYVIKSGVRYFEAAEPSRFVDELKEKQEKIQAVMPELEGLKSILNEKPQIELYEDIAGLKSIFNDILKENKEILFIGTPQLTHKMQFYFPHFAKQKRKQGIFSRLITLDCEEMRKYKQEAPAKYNETRFIENDIEITKIIYGDKVAYLTFKEKNSIGVLIDNKEIADAEKMLFEILWNNSKE